MAKDNKVVMKIKGYDPSSETNKSEEYQAAVQKGSTVSEIVKSGLLYSTADHDITVKYGEEQLVVPAKTFAMAVDLDKLDKNSLPKGLLIKEN